MRVGILNGCGLTFLTGMTVITGCSSAQYQGYSPSSRTFSESPAIKDYYVGMNFNFAVDRPTEYRSGASTSVGSALAVPSDSTPASSVAQAGRGGGLIKSP